jgi:pyruvate dehydrogenase (quinone)/pyruvate oxidase
VGFTVDDPTQCGVALDRFLAAPGPAILQAVVDPLEAPLPAKITAEQALKFAESLARGEPDGMKIVAKAVGNRVRELI